MAALLLVSAPVAAQEQPQLTTTDGWYKYGVPFPDLDGPVPRMPDGKPDLSGQWATQRRADITNDRILGYVPELPYTEWGQRLWDNYDPEVNGDYAVDSCLTPSTAVRSLTAPLSNKNAGSGVSSITSETRCILILSLLRLPFRHSGDG